MNDEDIEQQMRASLARVDRARVSSPTVVAAAVERVIARRRLRRPRVIVAIAATLVAAVVVSLVIAFRGPEQPLTRIINGPAASGSASAISAPSAISASNATPTPTTTSAATTTIETTTSTASQAGAWHLLPADPRGTAYDSEVVWTGREAIALGGRDQNNQLQIDGAAYDPAQNSWRRIARAPGAGYSINPLVAWTGTVVMVIGGDNPDGSLLVSGASSYNPLGDAWRTLASPPIGFVTSRSPWVWTGTTLLVWPWDGGGSTMSITPMAYDPTTNVWQTLPEPPVERRQDAASVWTGTEWVVWGGRDGDTELADGAAFTPATGSWRVLAPSPLAARHARAVWTGTEMIVAAGASGPDSGPLAFGDGAAYNPSADTWRPIANGPSHPGFAPVWTGKVVLSFFKQYEFTYNPATDRWIEGPADDHAAVTLSPVWTGTEAVLLGGTNGTGGAAYTPPP